jgi:hypothetical protein
MWIWGQNSSDNETGSRAIMHGMCLKLFSRKHLLAQQYDYNYGMPKYLRGRQES